MPTEAQKFAEDYGYALAFLKSSPELYSIFQKAMNGDWDATRFVAAVKASKWYKTHGEAWRTNVNLKKTDPATYTQNLRSMQAAVRDMAKQMGVTAGEKTFLKIAEDSVLYGYNESQQRDLLSAYVKLGKGVTTGQAGDTVQGLRETAFKNGLTMSNSWYQNAAKQVASGNNTVDDFQRSLRAAAKQVAPGFAKELDGGMDLYDVASPYMQSMAQTLELNPSDVDLFDPTIRKALATSSDKDGQAGSVPLWQFEQQLRQDPRFMKTGKAQNDVMATGRKVLQDLGLVAD